MEAGDEHEHIQRIHSSMNKIVDRVPLDQLVVKIRLGLGISVGNSLRKPDLRGDSDSERAGDLFNRYINDAKDGILERVRNRGGNQKKITTQDVLTEFGKIIGLSAGTFVKPSHNSGDKSAFNKGPSERFCLERITKYCERRGEAVTEVKTFIDEALRCLARSWVCRHSPPENLSAQNLLAYMFFERHQQWPIIHTIEIMTKASVKVNEHYLSHLIAPKGPNAYNEYLDTSARKGRVVADLSACLELVRHNANNLLPPETEGADIILMGLLDKLIPIPQHLNGWVRSMFYLRLLISEELPETKWTEYCFQFQDIFTGIVGSGIERLQAILSITPAHLAENQAADYHASNELKDVTALIERALRDRPHFLPLGTILRSLALSSHQRSTSS